MRLLAAAFLLPQLLPRLLGAQAGGDALARFRAAPKETARFATLWSQPPQEFRRRWDRALATDLARLDSASASIADAEAVQLERMRLRLRHAMGRVAHPYFAWREGAAESVRLDTAAVSAALALPLEDPSLWSLPEHRDLVGAVLHELARDAMRRDPELQRGDVRWLRAELAATPRLRDSALVRRSRDALVLAHLDDNGSRGTEAVLAEWRRSEPDPDLLARADSLVDLDRARNSGHRTATYRTVDGVDLALHFLPGEGTGAAASAGAKPPPAPAMLWFHGGSWTTGTWWHAPVIPGALRSDGVMVIGVELRTGSRFDAGPVEQLDDAVRAYEWVRTHAAELGVDSARIGVAGFSSGATLALMVATRGLGEALAPLPRATPRRYPAAVIAMGACADPAGPSEDGYFRRTVARSGPLATYSPPALVASGQPPLLAIHGTEDEFCRFAETRGFVERYRGAGNEATLASVNGGVHFFPFFDRPGQAEARRAIGAALRRWGWVR